MKTSKSFQKLCPNWAKLLEEEGIRKAKNTSGGKLDINNPMRCIVGEAYKFKNWTKDGRLVYDGCTGCDNASMRLWKVILYGLKKARQYDDKLYGPIDSLKKEIDKFVTHFEAEHK